MSVYWFDTTLQIYRREHLQFVLQYNNLICGRQGQKGFFRSEKKREMNKKKLSVRKKEKGQERFQKSKPYLRHKS